MVEAIVRELTLRKGYIGNEIGSLYFGGGTPSLLSGKELGRIVEAVKKEHHLEAGGEVTVEMNPDDMNEALLEDYLALGVNRLSLGIQSFRDEDLQFMNRAHNATEAATAVDLAKKAGFDNLTVDLIYGTPGLSNDQWRENIARVLSFGVDHVSAYNLTVEEGTALHHQVAKGEVPGVDDAASAEQFGVLMDGMEAAGFVHYEISNFARPGHEAVHNSKYWTGAHYLGLGPGAHSYNGMSRQWNIPRNKKYIDQIAEGNVPFEIEDLSETEQYNEYLLTRLRTRRGAAASEVEQLFGADLSTHFGKHTTSSIEAGLMERDGDRVRLTRQGKLVADSVVSDMLAED